MTITRSSPDYPPAPFLINRAREGPVAFLYITVVLQLKSYKIRDPTPGAMPSSKMGVNFQDVMLCKVLLYHVTSRTYTKTKIMFGPHKERSGGV